MKHRNHDGDWDPRWGLGPIGTHCLDPFLSSRPLQASGQGTDLLNLFSRVSAMVLSVQLYRTHSCYFWSSNEGLYHSHYDLVTDLLPTRIETWFFAWEARALASMPPCHLTTLNSENLYCSTLLLVVRCLNSEVGVHSMPGFSAEGQLKKAFKQVYVNLGNCRLSIDDFQPQFSL